MKVFISADIEGTAGITDWSEADKSRSVYEEFRELMTGELLAACEGATAAGATEILVKDAHASGRNLILSRLPEHVRIVRGWSGHPLKMMQGLDESFDAALFTGYHAKAGVDENPLAHTLTGRVSRLMINGEVASEFTINAYAAAMLEVPPVFISGDEGICGDARKLAPEIATVGVSRGYGPSTESMSPARARTAIRDEVKRVLETDLSACALPLPDRFELDIEFNTPTDAYAVSFYPGARHSAHRTVHFEATDYFEILRAIRFLT